MEPQASNRAYSQAGSQLTAPGPRLEQSAERLDRGLGELHELISRLSNVADRVSGPVPEAVEKSAPNNPASSASAARLEQSVEGFHGLLRRLNQVAARLETL